MHIIYWVGNVLEEEKYWKVMTVIVSILNSECCEGNYLDRLNSRALTSILLFFLLNLPMKYPLKAWNWDNEYFICKDGKTWLKQFILRREFMREGNRVA